MKRLRVRDGCFRDADGTPVYLIGANFWPRHTGPWMYRDLWDAKAVSKDLRELAALSANAVRIFCFLPDFLPAPDAINHDARDRLEATIDLAARAGMWSIPTFLVGHMSGENWAPDWSNGKNWYTDPLLLDASEFLIGSIVAHFAADERIAAWLLTNEWPIFAGSIGTETSTAWAQRLVEAARAADPTCTISGGDGAWDLVEGRRGVPSTPALAKLMDFIGPHFYPKETDSLRHTAFAGFAMKMVQPCGRPVMLEEFGCSSDQADDELAAAYYRTTLWSAFGAGNCGTLVWNSHDFTVPNRRPYSHHPYELHFGMIRVDGSSKPQANEFKRFAEFRRRHSADEWRLVPSHVTIGRSSFYTHEFPFDWGWTRSELRDIFLQSYCTCMAAGMEASFTDLATLPEVDVRLMLVPCLQQVTAQDAQTMRVFAQSGGTVYLSYGGEPWFPDLGSFIGARLLIRYGLLEHPRSGTCEVRFVRDFGTLQKGTTLRFSIVGEVRRSAPLRCIPQDASVIAHESGEPILLERPLGKGRVVFLARPIEYYALNVFGGERPSPPVDIYRALAHASGVAQEFASADSVQFFVWQSRRDPRRRRLLAVNHAWEPAEFVAPEPIRDLESGQEATGEIRLQSKGVRIFEITGAV